MLFHFIDVNTSLYWIDRIVQVFAIQQKGKEIGSILILACLLIAYFASID